MNRAIPAAIAAAGVLSVLAVRAPDARAADSADECVRMREVQVAEGLMLAVDNNCSRTLSCTLSWTVQCESATGRVTRRTSEGARFVVGRDSSRSANASARSCGDGWRIQDVTWSCASVKS